MAGLDDLFPDTVVAPTPSYHASDGGHFYRSGLGSLGSLEHRNDSPRRFLLNIYDLDDEFHVEVHEIVTGISAKPSARIKNPRKRVLM